MNIFDKSIAQLSWPKERVSTNLCPKCGDCFHLDLHQLNFDETLRSVRSGHSPDRAERLVYSELMADALRDVDRCQSELRRLQDLSSAINEQQQLLLMYMAGVRSMMSPIHKLPHEILGEIFEYVCCDDIGANCILPRNKKRLPTHTLSRVCIRWYNLVTSTPALWSSFGTQDLKSSCNPFLFKIFLERSHLHPVDFTVRDFASSLNDTSESPSNSLSLVTASARWRHVNIRGPKSLVQGMLQPLIAHRQNLPVLVSLSIDCETLELIEFPITCPNLQRLTLSRVALEFQVPLPAVTHLDLHRLSPKQASRLIACCSNVQDITLRNFFISETIALPMISCVARRLAIKFGQFRTSIMDLLRSMTFPKLVHLVLSDSEVTYNTPDVENLWPMLERSHRHLTHLSLHSLNFTPNQLLHLFLCVPTVTTLDLEETPILSDTPGVYLVLRALIAPLQQNQPEKPIQDRDSDGMTLESEDRLHEEDGGELECDDREDEEIDLRDKARIIEVFEGQCLLPRLKELDLIIRPRNNLLLQVVHSRWRPSSLLVPSDDISDSGACVCLQKLRVKYTGNMVLRRALEKSLYRFKKGGMIVDVSH